MNIDQNSIPANNSGASLSTLHIALYEPEIPQNTGNIGRLCLGFGATLHLIEPLGFSLSEKSVRRAGLDYWSRVPLQVHNNIDDFFQWCGERQIVGLSTKAETTLNNLLPTNEVVLLFGPESRGLPDEIRNRLPCFRIPMTEDIRSLNLANAVAISAFQMRCHLSPEWF